MEKSHRGVVMEEAEETVTMVTVPNDVGDQMKDDPQNTVLCSPCNLWFCDVLRFIRHHSQHEIQREVQCLLCKQSFTTKLHLVDHYENFHNIKLFAAPAALPESEDRDQTTHVDHSYFRAENEKQEETDIDAQKGADETDLLENAESGEEKSEIFRGGQEKTESVGGEQEKEEMVGEDAVLNNIINTEPVIKKSSVEYDSNAGDCLNALAEIGNKQGPELGSCNTEIAVVDADDKEKNEGEPEEGGAQSPCREYGLSDSVSCEDHKEEAEEKRDEEEKEEGQMREVAESEDTCEERMSPFDEIQGGSTTLNSIHSDQLDDNDDSNTFMEQIHLETGDDFQGTFSEVSDEHGEEDPVSDESSAEMVPEYKEGDFRFISGLRHRQIHIANTNLVTDIGMQVFICLHCDFIDSEAGLVNHMQKTHKQILELESTMLQYSRELPADRVFPENITAEEVMRLSEYHQRNLEQKHVSSKNSKRTARTDGVREKRHLFIGNRETSPKKKRYVENRVPCLCPECGKVLCRKSALRTHILGVHSRSRNHLCEVCGKAFRAAYHLSQHRKSHRTKTFSCDLCDFTSDVRMDIFDHQQLHPNKFILCHVCGTVLKSKTALTRHMMVHSESRPFACTIEGCTWRFTSEALCKGHIESHNSPGEFSCLECKRRFRKRHHIRRHLKTVHGKVSNGDADKYVAVDAKVVPSAEQFGQIPVTQLSKQHIMITTDEHGTPIFCDQNEELVFDSKTSSLLQVTVKPTDGI